MDQSSGSIVAEDLFTTEGKIPKIVCVEMKPLGPAWGSVIEISHRNTSMEIADDVILWAKYVNPNYQREI
jgi:hypothetical protein